MPPNNGVIPFYQLRAIQALLRAGMRADSILDAVNAFRLEGDGFLQDLRAIESVSLNVLPSWVKAVGQKDSDTIARNSYNNQENQLTPKPSALDDVVPPSDPNHPFTTTSTGVRIPLLADNDDYNPTAPIECHPGLYPTTSRQRKAPQFMARHCIGSNGKCTAKSKKVWKYQGPWESHFRAEHLNDFLDVLTCTYVCFCSSKDFGNASELMEHIWETHMVNSVSAQSTTSET